MARLWSARLLVCALLLLLRWCAAFPFGPSHIDWSSFTCGDLTVLNTDQLDDCSFSVVNGDHQEVSCLMIVKQRDTNAIVAAYHKVLLLTLNFRIMRDMPDSKENVFCASVVSMKMEIRNDSIPEIRTVGDLPPSFVSFLYYLTDDTYIVLNFTKKVPSAIITVNPDCTDNSRKKTEGTHCVESVRFLKEIKRGAFHLQFPSDEFWSFLKRRFIGDLGAEMTQLQLTSTGQLSAIALQFFTRLISRDLHMRELTLASLSVGHLSGPVVTMPTLEVLRLPDNGIISISDATLAAVPNIQQLDVAGNVLEDLPELLPVGLAVLNASHNRLVTLPRQLPQHLSHLNISYNVVETLPEALPAALLLLDAAHNALETLPAQLPPGLRHLDVSHNRLQTLPTGLPPTLETLKVAHNQLKTIDPRLLAALDRLQLFDVSHNSLTAVDGVWLTHQLPLLNLSHNALRHIGLLGPGNVSHVDASHNAIESWEMDADRLSLVGNPRAPLGLQPNSAASRVGAVDLGEALQIDCDPCSAGSSASLQLRRWLLRQQSNASLDGPRLERPARPLCSAPQALAGRALELEADLEDASHCPGSPRHVAQLLLLAVAVLALPVAGAIFCHHRRYEITYIFHLVKMRRERMAAERRNPASYKYDAFVCYSSADRAWVVGDLLHKMEHAGVSPEEPALRLCLHERDFPLGSLITDNIMQSMRNSRCTVVILSQAFVDSQWCRWELELASSKVSRLVLLELARLDRASLPRHLRYLMDTRTYLEWPAAPRLQPAMWRRLREALGAGGEKTATPSVKDSVM